MEGTYVTKLRQIIQEITARYRTKLTNVILSNYSCGIIGDNQQRMTKCHIQKLFLYLKRTCTNPNVKK